MAQSLEMHLVGWHQSVSKLNLHLMVCCLCRAGPDRVEIIAKWKSMLMRSSVVEVEWQEMFTVVLIESAPL